MHILLVEDDADDAELTLNTFNKNKLVNKIHWVKDGQEALDFLFQKGTYQGQDTSFLKMILLDLKLPKVSGLEVLAAIKANPKTKDIPVVVLTSSDLEKDIQECYRKGANSFIQKPVDFKNFQKVVKEIGLYWMITNKLPNF